jgi:hypothetical protein
MESSETIARTEELARQFAEGREQYRKLADSLSLTPEKMQKFRDNLSAEDRAKYEAEKENLENEIRFSREEARRQAQLQLSPGAAPAKAGRKQRRNYL